MTKIVQSFWSCTNTRPIEGTYGWLRPEYHLISWALSTHLIRNHYNDLVLYTDKAGEDLLIKQLKLPFTEVHVELDALNDLSPNSWPLSKIYTYSRQREPFLHVDGDVFIWQPFDKRIERGRLAVQNVELIPRESYDGFISLLDFVPELLRDCRPEFNSLEMFNVGVFGGREFTLFQEYFRIAFDATKRNADCLRNSSPVTYGLFIEQLLVTELAKHYNIDVERVFPEVFDNPHYAGFADFTEVPFKRKFIHLLGRYKSDPKTLKLLSNQLSEEFPEVYERVIEVCKDAGLRVEGLHDKRDIECHRYYRLLNTVDKNKVGIITDHTANVKDPTMDELDVELLQCLSTSKTLQQLLDQMTIHFEDESGPEYEELIIDRLKSFIFNRMLIIETVSH